MIARSARGSLSVPAALSQARSVARQSRVIDTRSRLRRPVNTSSVSRWRSERRRHLLSRPRRASCCCRQHVLLSAESEVRLPQDRVKRLLLAAAPIHRVPNRVANCALVRRTQHTSTTANTGKEPKTCCKGASFNPTVVGSSPTGGTEKTLPKEACGLRQTDGALGGKAQARVRLAWRLSS